MSFPEPNPWLAGFLDGLVNADAAELRAHLDVLRELGEEGGFHEEQAGGYRWLLQMYERALDLREWFDAETAPWLAEHHPATDPDEYLRALLHLAERAFRAGRRFHPARTSAGRPGDGHSTRGGVMAVQDRDYGEWLEHYNAMSEDELCDERYRLYDLAEDLDDGDGMREFARWAVKTIRAVEQYRQICRRLAPDVEPQALGGYFLTLYRAKRQLGSDTSLEEILESAIDLARHQPDQPKDNDIWIS